MIRAVLDEVVPIDALSILRTENVSVATFPDLWRNLSDRTVLENVSDGAFDWLITCDKQMPYQQNLRSSSTSVLVLPTPQLVLLTRIREALQIRLLTPYPGKFVILDDFGTPDGDPTFHRLGAGKRNK